jgi:hypothetical protein
MKYKENIDYELIPSSTDDDHWNVRFLTGDYVETVIAYGKISLEGNGVGDTDTRMSFNLEIVNTPDPDLTDKNEDFQSYAGDILLSIISESLERPK